MVWAGSAVTARCKSAQKWIGQRSGWGRTSRRTWWRRCPGPRRPRYRSFDQGRDVVIGRWQESWQESPERAGRRHAADEERVDTLHQLVEPPWSYVDVAFLVGEGAGVEKRDDVEAGRSQRALMYTLRQTWPRRSSATDCKVAFWNLSPGCKRLFQTSWSNLDPAQLIRPMS